MTLNDTLQCNPESATNKREGGTSTMGIFEERAVWIGTQRSFKLCCFCPEVGTGSALSESFSVACVVFDTEHPSLFFTNGWKYHSQLQFRLSCGLCLFSSSPTAWTTCLSFTSVLFLPLCLTLSLLPNGIGSHAFCTSRCTLWGGDDGDDGKEGWNKICTHVCRGLCFCFVFLRQGLAA